MKLISLNTYAGYVFKPLMDFIKLHANDTDIFCFQEVLNTNADITTSHGMRANLMFELSTCLPNFHGFFALAQANYDHTSLTKNNIDSGMALFIKRDHQIQSHGDFFIHGTLNSFDGHNYYTMPMNAGFAQIIIDKHVLNVINVHGTAWTFDKLDTPERLQQSQMILNFVQKHPGSTIIAGDFNLFPDTESITMIERHGFRNMIKQYSISTTRGSMNKLIHPDYGRQEYGWQEFADYVFISPEITPIQFNVPDLPISDHLSIILEFKIV